MKKRILAGLAGLVFCAFAVGSIWGIDTRTYTPSATSNFFPNSIRQLEGNANWYYDSTFVDTSLAGTPGEYIVKKLSTTYKFNYIQFACSVQTAGSNLNLTIWGSATGNGTVDLYGNSDNGEWQQIFFGSVGITADAGNGSAVDDINIFTTGETGMVMSAIALSMPRIEEIQTMAWRHYLLRLYVTGAACTAQVKARIWGYN